VAHGAGGDCDDRLLDVEKRRDAAAEVGGGEESVADGCAWRSSTRRRKSVRRSPTRRAASLPGCAASAQNSCSVAARLKLSRLAACPSASKPTSTNSRYVVTRTWRYFSR
jgi:hypothetical protein